MKPNAKYWDRKPVTQAAAVWRIEGESVTVAQIAERLGVTRTTVEHRMRKLRDASGALTWQRLRDFGRPQAA